ncbi:sodium:proton antiporter NhaD [endosymbiont of Ridgeia piscesae]|uniref:Na+/H+ antiporter, NhaD family n=1 Tax=endosymbiont of Ridgeia piscesae TaxID=54398 RepID=A0A0T5Z9Z0_9GAMM|nr:sodium:proton antiporter NhaD [endosymbiont of Ridgeia piscesae]KRT56459.1 sodium/proton antiporter, NhaD family [endosymbiont of Ridgeia piscesae]KRT59599.1 Na+/H+ antiporter, NhaD family [endosymbiont of Ridgeia piscesae]
MASRLIPLLMLLLVPGLALAAGNDKHSLDLTDHWVGFTAIAIFVLAYALVMAEEFTHLRKSKPVILAAGLIWGIVAWYYQSHGLPDATELAVRHNLLEYAELMLFLLVAMTYINAMDERNVFEALRSWLIKKGFGFRQLFWITGTLAFFISPIADNLTTALLMCAVVLAVGGANTKFILLACINIVVAANAGGAFSPFGDITTLMVWQKNIATPQGTVDFFQFFYLFLPAIINWVVPAVIMSFAVPNENPQGGGKSVSMKRGARRIITLFLLTIITAVSFHNFIHMPPVIGMLTGLAYLQFFGYYLKKTYHRELANTNGEANTELEHDGQMGDPIAFDVFNKIARAEWDTLLFFYGVVLCVGGLGFIGYLALASEVMYTEWGTLLGLSAEMSATPANVAVGLLSAVVDNIPVMFAVLTMMPNMSEGQWLLATLTAGVGGSMLSIGSAAGVALMGQARGKYTFFGHLKWAPVIALGYIASILTHLWLNSNLF